MATKKYKYGTETDTVGDADETAALEGAAPKSLQQQRIEKEQAEATERKAAEDAANKAEADQIRAENEEAVKEGRMSRTAAGSEPAPSNPDQWQGAELANKVREEGGETPPPEGSKATEPAPASSEPY